MNGLRACTTGLLAALILAASAQADVAGSPEKMEMEKFAELPVAYQGRIKPYDTLARVALLIISDRQTWEDRDGERRPAVQWLLDVISGAPEATRHRVFRIENKQVLSRLGLEPREGFRYAIEEFHGKIRVFQKDLNAARRKKEGKRSLYETRALEIGNHLQRYMRLRQAFNLSQLYHRILRTNRTLGSQGRKRIQKAVGHYKRIVKSVANQPVPHAIPPAKGKGDWRPFVTVAFEEGLRPYAAGKSVEPVPAARDLAAILHAWRNDNAGAFNRAVERYRSRLGSRSETDLTRLSFETFFNKMQPFYRSLWLYVAGFIVTCLGWLVWRRPLHWTGAGLIFVGLLIHTFGIALRIYLSGRPPVTNLYSSAVFMGWAAVIGGLIIQAIYRMGFGNVVAGILGAGCVFVAHHLAMAQDQDTLQVMQAVLDTNFWLATHVTTVTLGYTATFLAGLIGILFVALGVIFGLARRVTQADQKQIFQVLGRMIYGVLCFALLFSFVGTVLGGLWADDSWGRFWGWDPKENGALIIVLWNALILHSRWGGMIRERGLAHLAIVGNIVTSWSWFGVNMLGVGLHSYGFMGTARFWLSAFVISQLLIIAVGLIPLPVWNVLTSGRRSSPRTGASLATSATLVLLAVGVAVIFIVGT